MWQNLFYSIQLVAVFLVFGAAAGKAAEPFNPAHALAQKFATEGKATQKSSTAPTSHDDEKEMLEAARAEAEARRSLTTTGPADRAQPAATKTAQSQTQPAASTNAAPTATPPQAPARAQAPPARHMQIKVEARIAAPAATAPSARDASTPRASILVVLTDGRGSSDGLTTSDPVICLGEMCYVSAGLEKEALLLKRADVLSTRNTITNGAGACRGMKHCAFRGVSVAPGAELQIIDLGIVKHDRRDQTEVRIDTSCRLDAEDLICDHPFAAPDHRIWIVPETVAAEAGPAKLEAALNDELPEEDVARAGDK